MRKTLALLSLLALAACSATPAPQVCVPPQQFQAGFCVDTDGNSGGSNQGGDTVDSSAPAVKRK